MLRLVSLPLFFSFAFAQTCVDPNYTYDAVLNTCYRVGTPSLQPSQIFWPPQSWSAAEATCRADFGHLISIHSTAGNQELTTITGGAVVWIGLSYDGNTNGFNWTDGTIVNYNALAGFPSIFFCTH